MQVYTAYQDVLGDRRSQKAYCATKTARTMPSVQREEGNRSGNPFQPPEQLHSLTSPRDHIGGHPASAQRPPDNPLISAARIIWMPASLRPLHRSGPRPARPYAFSRTASERASIWLRRIFAGVGVDWKATAAHQRGLQMAPCVGLPAICATNNCALDHPCRACQRGSSCR